MIDTPVYLQFLIFSSLKRLKVGHFGVLEKGVKIGYDPTGPFACRIIESGVLG